MVSVFSSLNLSIIFGNRKMFFGEEQETVFDRACAGGDSPFCGQVVALRSNRQIMQNTRLEKPNKSYSGGRREQELATLLMRSAQG